MVPIAVERPVSITADITGSTQVGLPGVDDGNIQFVEEIFPVDTSELLIFSGNIMGKFGFH